MKVLDLYLAGVFVKHLGRDVELLDDQNEVLTKTGEIITLRVSFADGELSGCVGLSVDDEE